MLSLPENSQAQACSVVDCRRCWLHLCKVTTVLYHIFPNGRAIIGFNHGLPWCVKYMALGPPVATKPSGFAVGFCGDRRPSCHVFHTSRQAMIKTYNQWWLSNCGLLTLHGNIRPGNSLLPDGTKPLPEPMSSHLQHSHSFTGSAQGISL